MCVNVYVCLSETGGTRASIVLQLATCHWVIKAEKKKKSNKRGETIQTLKHREKDSSEAGEERLSTREERLLL